MLPAKILQMCAAELAPSLTRLYNISFASGLFPNTWKFANITRVYKKGDRDQCSDYRPISLLCILSKVFERCFLNRVYDHVSQHISRSQHGFQPGRSTTTQLFSVYNDINNSLNQNIQTDTIFRDCSKALDSVSYRLLLL